MIHDLRNPTIVIAGAFNPFIFTPQWIANVLYGVPEGDEVNGIMVTDLMTQTTRPYLDDVAIIADVERLSLFVDLWNDDCIGRAESLVKNVCDALPHTPVQGIGINFRYYESDFDPAIAHLLEQGDNPSRLGAIVERNNLCTIDCGDGIILNLRRTINEAELDVRFNYHYDAENLADVKAFVDGKVREFEDSARSALALLYDVNIEEIEFKSAINR